MRKPTISIARRAAPADNSMLDSGGSLAPTELQRQIAEAAYFRAEQRGFAAGHELDDWLAAEAEVVGHSLERRLAVSDTH